MNDTFPTKAQPEGGHIKIPSPIYTELVEFIDELRTIARYVCWNDFEQRYTSPPEKHPAGRAAEKLLTLYTENTSLLTRVKDLEALIDHDASGFNAQIASLRSEIESLRREMAELKTAHQEVLCDLGDAEAKAESLRRAVAEAADEIEAWGAYADKYFQDKHDLNGTVKRFRALSHLNPANKESGE